MSISGFLQCSPCVSDGVIFFSSYSYPLLCCFQLCHLWAVSVLDLKKFHQCGSLGISNCGSSAMVFTKVSFNPAQRKYSYHGG